MARKIPPGVGPRYPQVVVLFGATGDLARRKLLPGLFHLATQCPSVELVPVWMNNLGRVMPKGEPLPIPLLCTVTFGAPLERIDGEDKAVFLARARDALLALRPDDPDATPDPQEAR